MGGQLVHHLGVGKCVELGQFQQMRYAHGGESLFLYGFQVPAAALHVEDVFFLPDDVFSPQLDRGIATPVKNEGMVPAQKLRCVNALAKLRCVLTRGVIVPQAFRCYWSPFWDTACASWRLAIQVRLVGLDFVRWYNPYRNGIETHRRLTQLLLIKDGKFTPRLSQRPEHHHRLNATVAMEGDVSTVKPELVRPARQLFLQPPYSYHLPQASIR